MGRDYCAMPECSNFPGKIGKFGIPVKLHRLPTQQSIRRQWLIAISRKNYKPSSYSRVCSDHFAHGLGPSKHDPGKIPTEFLAQKSKLKHAKTTRKSPTERLITVNEKNKDVNGTPTSIVAVNDVISSFHSYAQNEVNEEPVVPSHVLNPDVKEQSAQVTPDYNHKGIQMVQPDIVIEDIKNSDQDIQFYTGLPNYSTLNALFTTFLQHGAESMATAYTDLKSSCTKTRKLSLIDEFLLVLMRLRLGLLCKDLAFRFHISTSSVSRIFNAWIKFMDECLQMIIFLPERKILEKNVPQCFDKFRDTRVVLDCTEVYIQTPSSLENKILTYSHYKSHNTFKSLVGVSMTGAVVFLSDLYGGSISDTEITRKSGLYEKLNDGDAVMVDKGFIHIKGDLEKLGVKLYCPPFKTKKQLTKNEVELTRRIASARIHVERKMEQIKNFRILQGVMPLSISHVANEIFRVCAALTNLLPPLAN